MQTQFAQHRSNLRTLNDQIRYTGQYYANKEVYSQFSNAKYKGKYRKEHNRDEVKQILLNFENETDKTLEDALEYHKPGCREALTVLKENGWNIWR